MLIPKFIYGFSLKDYLIRPEIILYIEKKWKIKILIGCEYVSENQAKNIIYGVAAKPIGLKDKIDYGSKINKEESKKDLEKFNIEMENITKGVKQLYNLTYFSLLSLDSVNNIQDITYHLAITGSCEIPSDYLVLPVEFPSDYDKYRNNNEWAVDNMCYPHELDYDS